MDHRKNARRQRALERFPKSHESRKGKRTHEQWVAEKERTAELVRKRKA